MVVVPDQFLPIYNDTWKRFADTVKNLYLNECTCRHTDICTIYKFLKSADFDLEIDNIVRFENNINAANNLLKYYKYDRSFRN